MLAAREARISERMPISVRRLLQKRRRQVAPAALDGYPTYLGEGFNRGSATVPAQAAVLHAAERHNRFIMHRRIIDI